MERTVRISMPPITQLRITVYENGRMVPADGYSAHELAALDEAIEELWSPTFHSTRSFEVDVADDSETLLLVYRDDCSTTNLPIPEAWLTKTLRFGVKREPLRLVGDRLPIKPRQFGLSPWPDLVQVQFTLE
jgi:hypothetical protein